MIAPEPPEPIEEFVAPTRKPTRPESAPVGTVFIPVGDQVRALKFYLDNLGFEKRTDFPYGKRSRWIDIAPTGHNKHDLAGAPERYRTDCLPCEDARPNRAFLTRPDIWEMRDSW